MVKVRTTYAKHTVCYNAKYKCPGCGHTFYRKNSDWFTMSPFNKSSISESQRITLDKCKQKIRCCPKCQTEVKPS
jgi:hypothetical protein